MEEITNEDLKNAKDQKFMTESRRAVGRIGKDDKIDTSKMKIRLMSLQEFRICQIKRRFSILWITITIIDVIEIIFIW